MDEHGHCCGVICHQCPDCKPTVTGKICICPEAQALHGKWKTSDGRMIPYREMEDTHLISVLRMLKRKAIKEWREACEKHGDWETWEPYAHEAWPGLLEEAKRRSLVWEDPGKIDLTNRSHLERGIVGALRDCINAHGPIISDTAPSAAKRIIGVIKAHNERTTKDDGQASASGS